MTSRQVWDTSSFITARRVHYRPARFPSVWAAIEAAMGDGRVVSPRAVYRELQVRDDEVFQWAKAHRIAFRDPDANVQRAAGLLQRDYFSKSGVHDAADPWVIAEAQVHRVTVVTLEGVHAYTNAPSKKWPKKMPGICARLRIPCITVADALDELGVTY